MKRLLSLALVLVLALFAGCGGGASSSTSGGGDQSGEATGWVPTKPIEITVPNGAGGGSDVFARTVVKIIEDYNFCPQPFVVVNKPGGSTSIGYTYVAEQKGDNHVLATVSSSFYTTPLQGNSSVSYKDFTFITHMCEDPSALVVNASSDYHTVQDLVDAINSSTENMSGGGSGTMSDDAIACYMLREATSDLNYVPFGGGGEVLTAILGGHVDFAFLSPAECQEQVAAGNLRLLATTADERLDNFPDLPTFKESGVDIEMAQGRGWVMPLDVDPEAVAYYEDLFKKVFDTPEFQDFVDDESMLPEYRNAADYAVLAEENNKMYARYLEIIGVDIAQ